GYRDGESGAADLEVPPPRPPRSRVALYRHGGRDRGSMMASVSPKWIFLVARKAMAPRIGSAPLFCTQSLIVRTGSTSAPRLDPAPRVGGRRVDHASAQGVGSAAGLSQDTHDEIPPRSDTIGGAPGSLMSNVRADCGGMGPGDSETEPEEDEDGCSAKDLHPRLLSGGDSPAVSMAAEPDLSGRHRAANRVARKARRVTSQH